METNYSFVPMGDGSLRVDAEHQCTPDCPRKFDGVAYILEPESVNPGIQIPRGLGVNAVREIVQIVEAKEYLK